MPYDPKRYLSPEVTAMQNSIKQHASEQATIAEWFETIEHGGSHAFKAKLDAGLPLALVNHQDKSLLMYAIEKDRQEIIWALMAAGIDLNWANCSGNTALLTAAIKGDVTLLRQLAQRGANCAAMLKNGDNALHLAAAQGHFDVILFLLQTDKLDINAVNQQGQTPLMLAAKGGHLSCVEALIKHDAKLTVQDAQGQTLLHLAAKHDRSAILHYCYENCSFAELATLDAEGQPFLAFVRKQEDRRILLKKYLNNKPILSSAPLAALHRTLFNDAELVASLATVQALAQVPDPKPVSEERSAALMLAIENGDLAAINELLVAGIVFSAEPELAKRVVVHAYKHNQVDALRLLVEKGADPEGLDLGEKLSWYSDSSEYDYYDVLRYLIKECKIDPNQTRDRVCTPLFKVARHAPLYSLAKLFVEAGGDLNKTGTNSISPLMQSLKASNTATARLLVRAGANFSTTGNSVSKRPLQGDDCFEEALFKPEAIKFLLEETKCPRQLYARKHPQVETLNMQASLTSQRMSLQYLLEQNMLDVHQTTKPEVTHRDINLNGYSTLMRAIEGYHFTPGVERLLLAAGVNVHTKAANGETALSLCLEGMYPNYQNLGRLLAGYEVNGELKALPFDITQFSDRKLMKLRDANYNAVTAALRRMIWGPRPAKDWQTWYNNTGFNDIAAFFAYDPSLKELIDKIDPAKAELRDSGALVDAEAYLPQPEAAAFKAKMQQIHQTLCWQYEHLSNANLLQLLRQEPDFKREVATITQLRQHLTQCKRTKPAPTLADALPDFDPYAADQAQLDTLRLALKIVQAHPQLGLEQAARVSVAVKQIQAIHPEFDLDQVIKATISVVTDSETESTTQDRPRPRP